MPQDMSYIHEKTVVRAMNIHRVYACALKIDISKRAIVLFMNMYTQFGESLDEAEPENHVLLMKHYWSISSSMRRRTNMRGAVSVLFVI